MKRGELTVDSIVGLIIAVAGVVILVILASNMINPGYNEEDEIAKAYFERVEKSVEDGSGEIVMLDRGADEEDFYLVYFGSAASIVRGDKIFQAKNSGKSVFCVCYDKLDNVFCRYCEDLDLPARNSTQSGFGFEEWIIGEGGRVEILKETGGVGFYVS